ncbi:unnamed protein product [Victoria cruziana]
MPAGNALLVSLCPRVSAFPSSLGRNLRSLFDAPLSRPLCSLCLSSSPSANSRRRAIRNFSSYSDGGAAIMDMENNRLDNMAIDVNPPKGTRDFPPAEMRIRNWLFQNFREVSRLLAFEEVDFPVLESEALFIRKAGEEITEQAEAELIFAIVTLFKQLGITSSDVGFKVSSRKVLQAAMQQCSISELLFTKVCITIDKIGKMEMDEIEKDLASNGISMESVKTLLHIVSLKTISELEEALIDQNAIAELRQLFSLAEHYGYLQWIEFDASVVRGLAYYTGIVFEAFDRDGKLRAICGGGRYDRLLSTLGGEDLPACGFGFGDAVIVELLREKGLLPALTLVVDDIVFAIDGALQGTAAMVASTLRQKGRTVDLVLERKKLKWVFKHAERSNASRLILIGDSEWQQGMVRVKNLTTREESNVKIDDL